MHISYSLLIVFDSTMKFQRVWIFLIFFQNEVLFLFVVRFISKIKCEEGSKFSPINQRANHTNILVNTLIDKSPFIHTHTHAHACLRKVLNKLGHILNADFNLFIFDESSFHLVVNYEYLFILIRIIHNDCEVYHCTDRQWFI